MPVHAQRSTRSRRNFRCGSSTAVSSRRKLLPAREDAEPIVRLTELDPEDLFRKAFEKTHKRAPEAAHLDAFHRAAAEAAEGA